MKEEGNLERKLIYLFLVIVLFFSVLLCFLEYYNQIKISYFSLENFQEINSQETIKILEINESKKYYKIRGQLFEEISSYKIDIGIEDENGRIGMHRTQYDFANNQFYTYIPKKYVQGKKNRIISTVPVFMGLAFNIGESILEEKIGLFEGLCFLISKFRAENNVFMTLDSFDKISTYIPVILCILTLACLVISIYLIFKEKNYGLLQLLILFAGICSKFIMGFIVTVVVSQNRTSFIFIICMIILTVMILDQKSTKELERYSNVLIIMSFFMVFSNLCLCLNIG